MKRRDRNIGTRSDISRLGKPCSKIEAKLLSRRRSKKENEDKESARLTKPSIDSSSESEISPRLFTSKQHVELANFEAQNNVPLLQKYLQNSNEKYKYDSGIDLKKINSCNSKINIVERANFQSKRTNDISNVYTNDSYDKSDKTLNFSKKNHSKHLFDYFSTQHLSDTKSVIKLEKSSAHINNDSKRNTDEHLLANESNEKTFFPTNETTKRRSRSAPCTPLFKIKCSKDKFPCDLFAVGKSLTDDEIREKIRKHRKHAPISLRMSRSGEVSVSSYEKSSDERKIERISSEESTTENDLRELHIAIKKSPTSKTDEETVLVSDSEKNGIIRNEIIHDDDDDNGKATLKETNEFMKILPICTENSEIIENIAALPITEEKIQDEKITETISSPSGNFVNKEKPKIPENQHCSPKQLTKKRDFKWKTMMEKHRHQLVSRTSENFIKPVEMTDKMENSRSKFWPEATADIPKNNLRPTLRNSFEEKKIEAYNIIKEEFPKLFMKRQIVNAMTNKSIDINGEINSCRNIHKPNSLISRNVDIISKIMKSNFEDSKELGKKMYRSENHVGQRNILTNVEQSERKCRPSILKRPKSPSPRRVTFRLPGLVIHEKSLQHERNFAQTIEAQEIGLKNSLKPMDGFAEEPKDTETNDNSRQPDRLLSACIYEKVRKFHNDNLSICKETKQCSIPPRFSAIEKNALESDDFTQDWETPPTADTHRCFEEVKYPKETREAMKILSAGENLRCKHFGRVSSRGSAYRETEENYRPQNSLMAPSYAEALAKFQGSSDKAGQQSVPVMTKHNSGSRNTNVVVGK